MKNFFKMNVICVENNAKGITQDYQIKYAGHKKTAIQRRFSLFKFKFVYYFYVYKVDADNQ